MEWKKDNLEAFSFKFYLLDKTTSVNVMCFQIGNLEVKLKLKTWKNNSILFLFQTAAEGQISNPFFHYTTWVTSEKEDKNKEKMIKLFMLNHLNRHSSWHHTNSE